MLNLRIVYPLLKAMMFSAIIGPSALWADVTKIEITARETISGSQSDVAYESISGVAYFSLDPENSLDQRVTDLEFAPRNSAGQVEYSADFRLLVPAQGQANGGLLYNVNNRGGSRFPPEMTDHPLTPMGFTYLATGWINELAPGDGRLRLHAPIVSLDNGPITGDVRYEVSVSQSADTVEIAGGRHLAYAPTEQGQNSATLTQRLYQSDPRRPIERSQFDLTVAGQRENNQAVVTLNLDGGFEPGVIYELIYEASDPVLAGAGMSGIRDLVSLLRYGGESESELNSMNLPDIDHAVAWGNSQSGRLLRQYLYDGFNTDLSDRKVFDGVIPVIAGSGYGMFNNRFAMPTRTNGQHSNHLFPNDLFPFTYGVSTDPYTGRTDSIFGASREKNTVPKLMHVQTSNEYWVRGGSLPHTNPQGTQDAVLPDEVRFYTIGGSQHGSGNGIPRQPTSGQLAPNPNMWAPFSYSLIVAMYEWVADGVEPPPSRYPKISDGSLVASHTEGKINPAAWRSLSGVNHPSAIYKPAYVDYGSQWQDKRIVSRHPENSDMEYQAMVPAVNDDNNDSAVSTLLPPMTQVPLATFTPWNLRAFSTGADKSLARLSGGYIPFSKNANSRDPRSSVTGLYESFDDYLSKYEAATDSLIDQRYLLQGFKGDLMGIAQSNKAIFD